MKLRASTAALLLLTPCGLDAQDTPALPAPLLKALEFLQPPPGTTPRSLHLSGTVLTATGTAEVFKEAGFDLHLEPPGHLRLHVRAMGREAILSQNGQKIWIQVPQKKLIIIGDPATPRFSTRPDSVQPVSLNLMQLPVSRTQLLFLPALVTSSSEPAGEGATRHSFRPSPAAAAFPLPVKDPVLSVLLAADSPYPDSITYSDNAGSCTLKLSRPELSGPLPPETWEPAPGPGDHVETVALAHFDRFFKSTIASLGSTIPALPPATGQRLLLGTSGKGRLEDHDGTRVLFLAGTPEEMGRQHGTLLTRDIRRVIDRILYGVGVGSSFEKGRWFFGEIEEAVRRTSPFIDLRHLAEMDAIAAAAGLDPEEVRLANFFPELFHCSGFALLGKATTDGKMYHGRILDYLRGAGLEENAVVIVNRPDQGNAWVNISYAGFTGSVTAMSEKHLSIGEMGGRGEGNWDGKPMAQLVREVMEKTSTIDDALDFMRNSPRTCEYYYVLADAKSHRAAGVKATPDIFEVVWTGESHPELADPVPDTVLLSAGNRYGELVNRVKTGFGTFDAPAAIQLMSRPVCMTSNIHSVLFAPDTLDFWVANADSAHVASETRFTPYNLRTLLDAPPAPPKP